MTKPLVTGRTIRVAHPDDAKEFAALCARTFVSAYSELPRAVLEAYVSEAFGYEQQCAELTDPRAKVFVVDAGDALAGYVLVRDEEPPVALPGSSPLAISRLYLESAVRGRGFGSELFRHVVDHAGRKGNDQLWLTVWDHNTHARQVYASWGFEDVGAVRFDLLGIRQTDRVLTRRLLQVG